MSDTLDSLEALLARREREKVPRRAAAGRPVVPAPIRPIPAGPPPDTPGSLWKIAREVYGPAELARRALYAPIPLHGFGSAYSLRHLWQGPQRGEAARKRLSVEAELRFPLYAPAPILKSLREPFFPAPGTEGNLTSPYWEIPDSYYWLIFMLNRENEAATRRAFERPAPSFLGHSLLELARWSQPVSSWRYLWLRVRKALDWRRLGYDSFHRPIVGQVVD